MRSTSRILSLVATCIADQPSGPGIAMWTRSGRRTSQSLDSARRALMVSSRGGIIAMGPEQPKPKRARAQKPLPQ